MRTILIAAAALLTAGITTVPASANGYPPPQGWHGGGPHHGWHRWHGRRCTWVWRHHHRVRRCW